jgi:hypothetical protein
MKKSNPPDFQAESELPKPERKMKVGFDLKSAPELRAQAVSLNPIS